MIVFSSPAPFMHSRFSLYIDGIGRRAQQGVAQVGRLAHERAQQIGLKFVTQLD